jgi:KDEL-tailed cysteine endopeptidase
LDHAVLAVGYGKSTVRPKGPYIIVKNQWGSSWGDGGYAKINLSKKNICGILEWSTYPILEIPTI